MQFNLDLHNQIIAKIEADPTCWNQGYWHCGSAHCYGGWAQILSGKPENVATVRFDMRQALGLTYWQANFAVDEDNTLATLKALPETFAGFNRLGFDSDGLDADNNLKA